MLLNTVDVVSGTVLRNPFSTEDVAKLWHSSQSAFLCRQNLLLFSRLPEKPYSTFMSVTAVVFSLVVILVVLVAGAFYYRYAKKQELMMREQIRQMLLSECDYSPDADGQELGEMVKR